MKVSIIVAASRNDVIGKDNDLIWHLSSDLKRFKSLTTGHHIIMGRKTFESIGKPLPNRTSIIITRQKDYSVDGCIVVNSLEEALSQVENEEEVFIIGGGSIYQEALEKADKIYLTRVHHDFDGDTFFPKLNAKDWESVAREDHMPDEKNPFPYSFIDLKRR
ncbi:MAG: dihydrofolate reductase [Marinifilaceae bacterium]|jgi:dihydrofolate reductase